MKEKKPENKKNPEQTNQQTQQQDREFPSQKVLYVWMGDLHRSEIWQGRPVMGGELSLCCLLEGLDLEAG